MADEITVSTVTETIETTVNNNEVLDVTLVTGDAVSVVIQGGLSGGGESPVTSVAGKTGAVILEKADITDFSDSDYATAAQGLLADSALQAGDNISELVNDSSFITLGDIPADLITSVFGRVGVVVAEDDDYSASQVLNDSSVVGDYVDDALNNLKTNLGTHATAISDNESAINAIELKTDYISVSQAVDLDTVESLANSALQSGDNISELVNDVGYLTSYPVDSVAGKTGAVVLVASDITDFDTEVSNNTDVAANTAARHDAVTVLDTARIDLSLTGQQISADLIAGSVSETYLNTSVNDSLDLADSALQSGDNISELTNDSGFITSAGAPVQSVNSQTGVVVLDADDIDDSATTNKFATQGELDNIALNTTHRTSDGSDHTFIDQDVTQSASPTFTSLSVTGDVIVNQGTALEFPLGEEVDELISTGLYSFGGLSINVDPTKFDINGVDGHIIDRTEGDESYNDVEYPVTTGITPLVSSGVTYLYIDKDSALVQTADQPTPESRRDAIYLGRVITSSGTIIQTQTAPVVLTNSVNQIYDLALGLGLFNINGNNIVANANLTFNKTVGQIFSLGSNFVTNPKDPHSVTTAAKTPADFFMLTQLARVGSSTTSIDNANYDNGGVVTAIGGASKQAQIMRVYLFPSNNMRVHYGQTIYSSLTDAVQAIPYETFIENPDIDGNGVLIAFIVVTKGCTDLTDSSQARIIRASKFGEGATGGAAQSVSSLQDAYQNSNEPEIVTDSTQGSVTIKEGQGDDTNDVIDVLNGSDVQTFSVKGNGNLLANNISVTGTVDGRDIAADGLLIDSALQSGDNVSELTNDSGYLTSAPTGFDVMPIGMPFPVLDTITGADVPSNSGTPQFIKLTASDAYNTGLLTSESVSGTAPLVEATAQIDLVGSPMNGEVIHLINTEGSFLRAMETADVLQYDQMQKITGELASRGGPHAQVFAGALNSNSGTRVNGGNKSTTESSIVFDSSQSPDARVSSTTSGETRPKNLSVTYYMRIL